MVNKAEIGGKAEGLIRLQELELPVPPFVAVPVGEEVDEAAVAALGEPLAVRSSAVDEDAADKSAAGQYETLLGITRATLHDAIERVRSGTDRARAYGAGGDVGVVVQRQVSATRAGVAFSRDPVGGADEIVVECALGGGEGVVSGQVTPDRYRVIGDHVHARATGTVRTLRDDEACEVAELIRRAEAGFGRPVDVEFCFEGRTIWLVQCRPITTV
jgi:phosphoenolpyruvate synthase/pyruvate phosphate dikinase